MYVTKLGRMINSKKIFNFDIEKHTLRENFLKLLSALSNQGFAYQTSLLLPVPHVYAETLKQISVSSTVLLFFVSFFIKHELSKRKRKFPLALVLQP